MAEENQENVQPEAEVIEFPDDPMAVIREEDAQRQDAELETALAKLTGEGEQPIDGDNVPETEAGTSEQETAPTPSGKRAPIDEVLANLRNSNLSQEEQEAIRATIATNTRLQQEAAGVDSKLDQAVRDAVSEALAEETQEVDDPLAQVTPQQEAIFAQLADKLGYVKSQDLEAKEEQQTREQYLSDGRKTALESFGDSFGITDTTGQVVLSDGVQERLTARYKPIQDHGTLTLHDLYVLEYHNELLAKAKAEGVEEGKGVAQGRRVERQQAAVETRTSGIGVTPQIRGEKGSNADSSESVFARAALLARRKLAS